MSLKVYRVTNVAVAVSAEIKSKTICGILARAEHIVDDCLIYDKGSCEPARAVQWIKDRESKRLLVLCSDTESAQEIVERIWPVSGPRKEWPATVITSILWESLAVFRVYSHFAQRPVRLYKLKHSKLVEVTPKTLAEESRAGEVAKVTEEKTATAS